MKNFSLAIAALVLAMSSGGDIASAYGQNPPRLANIATRSQVLTGDDVMIGGFVIGGSFAKTVVVRARGPSLAAFGVPGALANPSLRLFSGPTEIAQNDDFTTATNYAALNASGYAPSDPKESAILATLQPGAYTAIVSGVGGTTGVAIIEVFEVDMVESPLINIATRARVLTGDDVMIAGFIIQGNAPQTVVVRARGPSLAAQGVPGVLADPSLRLYTGQTVIATNDNYVSASNVSKLSASGFAPSDFMESAILITLSPGPYTAIVSGFGGGTGVGIVEVFAVTPGPDQAPAVYSTIPAHTAQQMPVTEPVTITFTEPMDPATITGGTVTLTGPNGPVAATVSANGNLATLFPAARLLTEATYTGRVTTSARDLTGNGLEQDYVFNFLTRVDEPPPIVAGCPAPQAGAEVRRLEVGPPRVLKRISGAITSYRLPPGATVDLLQGQVSVTPPSPITEMTVSRCPGVIETNLHSQCRLVSASPLFNKITAVDRPLSDDQNTAAGCLAPSTEQYYVNLRWTFPSCENGPDGCGFSLQWN